MSVVVSDTGPLHYLIPRDTLEVRRTCSRSSSFLRPLFENSNIRTHARLQIQLAWHNQHQVCRTTDLTPNQAWDLALKEKCNHHRPVPTVPLLDLHLARDQYRRLNADATFDFFGNTWPVTPVNRKSVTLVYHPEPCFWVIPELPDPQNPVWPDVLAQYRL